MSKFTIKMLALTVITVIAASCSTSTYKKQAELEAYGIVDVKAREVPGMDEEFSITQEIIRPEDFLSEAPDDILLYHKTDSNETRPTLLLNLDSALIMGAANSRDYQRRRETVFITALSLSTEYNKFSPQFFWQVRSEAQYSTDEKGSLGGRSRFGFNRLFTTGATLSGALTTSATRVLSGNLSDASSSLLELTLTQPLLKDSRIATLEPLTQAERNMVYELRDFVRYQRQFSVGILTDYYRVLERYRRVENERLNYENLSRIRERSEALSEAGRLPELQVDRARQNELAAQDSLDQALQNYQRALDDFKMKLGVSPDFPLVLNPEELDLLLEREIPEPPLHLEDSIEIALENRLDFATFAERVEDAERKVLVAENALKPDFDFVLGSNWGTASRQPLNFADGSRNSYVRLDADLPLERTRERNAYRERLIELDRAMRDFNQQRDSITLEITNRWRDLERAASSYQNQKRSVELAEERVESSEMLFDAGRATTRDVLDAHEDLLRAQNRLAAALVDLRIATLELERDMDILVIDEKGKIIEGAGYDEYTKQKR